ncbi:MAG: ABC transporter ATP-binding protein [Acidimicrobiia bacterium]
MASKELLLSVKDLQVSFRTDGGVVRAVNGVSLDVHRGDVVSIVGESGSGKSVSMLALMGLLPKPPAVIDGGTAMWKGRDLLTMSPKEMRSIRGKEISMIFQDPLSALNPVHRVGRQVGEVLRIHEGLSKKDALKRSVELLDLVGIPQPDKRALMYPHEFSGGMRQRAMIAMAIACQPDLLIADEPTTALDVTVQAQVLEVLIRIKNELNSAIVLITHDLGVVAGLSDSVMVMYAGRPVETGTVDEVYYETAHPYTEGLLASLPRLDATGHAELTPIKGAPPSLVRIPSGCPFHPRCPYVQERCIGEVPGLRLVGPGVHGAACHFADELNLTGAQA